jgi:site-specific recombinase XerD
MHSLVRVAPALLARRGRSLSELVPGFLQWFALVRRRSPHTVYNYGKDLERFLAFCAQAELTAPEAVDFRHVEFYLGWLQTARGLKPRSANRHLHALRTFFRYLVREGLAPANPAAECFMLPERRTLPGYLTVPEQERVLVTLAEDRSPLGWRDFALVATALLTGLRCAELAALQVAHVDLEAGRLRVVNGKGGRDRELPIIPRLEAILRQYLEEVRPQLLGRPLGHLTREAAHHSWLLVQEVKGRAVYRGLRTRDRAFAERRRAELIPLPAPPPFIFVNAHPTSSQRVRRAGLALSPKTIFALVRRAVAPIIGRPVAPHMLRHSFASHLRENGADLQIIQEALGHANITTTTMYAHLTTNRRRQELARLLG